MKKHDTMRLIRPVHEGDVSVPVGTRGTIAFAYSDDGHPVGFLLELRDHQPVILLNVQAADVEPEPPASGNWLSYLHSRNAARRARRE